MEKFEAGHKFLEMLEMHPSEFTVTHINENDYEAYRITHKASGVAVTVKINFGQAVYDGYRRTNNLNYVDPATTIALANYAVLRIEEEKTEAMVKEDNKLIDNLISFYQD